MTDIIKPDKYSNKADIFIDRSIGDDENEISAAQFKQELSAIPADSELNIFFDSNGGGVSDGREIYKAIRAHPGRTTAHIQGLAASIASVIAMACDEIFISADALVMAHNPHWSTSRSEALCSTGNQKLIAIPRQFNKQMPITIPTLVKDKNASVRRTLEDNRRIIKKHKNLLTKRKKSLADATEFILDVYHARSGSNRQELSEMMQAETWFTASDAVQFGFADFVTAPTGLVDHVDFSQFRNPNNFLARKYIVSSRTARKKRSQKVIRKKMTHMRKTTQKILNNIHHEV